MFRKTTRYLDQDYDHLKKDCVSSGKLFEDPQFPASSKSLSYKGDADSAVKWKRPAEIASSPKLFVKGADASDFKQGTIGNCWFVAACACIAETPKLWKKIVPDYEKQEWSEDNKYAGIFHFNFYREGEWIDVVIDDLLPTKNGQLIYTSSNDVNEFWSALLEKAYAKLFGDYESLTGGHGKDALVDMLGGVGQRVDFASVVKAGAEKQSEFFEELLEAHENYSQMTASVAATGGEIEEKMSNGLVKGHAYSVTAVRRVRQGTGFMAFFKNEKLDMIRLRNPWGHMEWTGAWSDSSPEWNKVSNGEKEAVDLVVKDDGEFWMSFTDFLANFTSIDICHMINTSWFSLKKTWSKCQKQGKWMTPHRAGGCGNHDSFLLNPQYVFDVKSNKDDVIISLEQQDQRMFKENNKENLTIGFAIHKADLNRKCRMSDKLDSVISSDYTNIRSIFLRRKFPRGRYLIVPSTFDPGQQAPFWLRVYCGSNPELTELVDEGPKPGGCFGPKYKVATHLTCVKATGLQNMEKGGADPYCIVKCEGSEFETPPCKDTLTPEWNWRFTLYRKSFASDIIVEIWNDNIIKDDFMGQCVIPGFKAKDNEGTKEHHLTGRKKEANVMKPGKLTLELKYFDDMDSA